MDAVHLLLKFTNETDNNEIIVNEENVDTITAHKYVLETKGKLVWGQGSKRKSSGVSKSNRDRFIKQINTGIDTYAFFTTVFNGKRDLYVGKMINIYDRREIPTGHRLINFVPAYYSHKVGTIDDMNSVYIEVNSFIKIEESYYENHLYIESTGKKISENGNFSSIFKVFADNELIKLLKIVNNPEDTFQYEVEQVKIPDDVSVEDRPIDKPEKTVSDSSNSYRRDRMKSKTAIVLAKYTCEIDESHEDFISRVTGKNYVEAHHLIPMEYQDDFNNSIDVEANIVSLCVGCHKKLHHATYSVIKPLIEKLYNDRIDRLIQCKINIAKDALLNYYK
ncbi:HNH endonuclease [Lysinibacillus capsici]|uniref:HNH endonuclease n=1 Tax=Lysinibacillus capsici TaxID=2115968 RepID=UPI002480F759|nr:restriction endonuclease [Lysinibacillus capsici]